MYIRKIGEEKLQEAMDLVWEVFLEFEAPYYPQEGISTFKEFLGYKRIAPLVEANKLILFGFFIDEELAGVIGLRNQNHICLFFVKKKYHRRGIGTKLFERLKEECKNESTITVHSSTFAIDVYHKLGFVDDSEEQFVNGIPYTPMTYKMNK